MSYEMKKIISHWIANHFVLTGLQIGWSFYPIIYKNNQYVVELRVVCCNVPKFDVEDIKVVCYIYEYGTKNKLFRKHKRKFIYDEVISVLSLDENRIINIEQASEEEIRMYLPQIIACIFQKYELANQQKADISKKITEAENWDGVVKYGNRERNE